jgi:hypothetical protein
MKVYWENLVKEPRSCSVFIPVILFLLIWLLALCSRLSIVYPTFYLTMLFSSYGLYVCVVLHATLSSWGLGWSYLNKTTWTCLFIWEPVVASVRLVHSRTWLKPQVANCFYTERPNAVTPRVLMFVNCLWCLSWNW